jgi:hypothetical protein
VTVSVKLARDREAKVDGVITFVQQTVQESTGDYIARAEIKNQQVDGVWLVRPGLSGASMTIHFGEPRDEAAQVSALERK